MRKFALLGLLGLWLVTFTITHIMFVSHKGISPAIESTLSHIKRGSGRSCSECGKLTSGSSLPMLLMSPEFRVSLALS